MTQITGKDFKVEMQIRGIELLGSSLTLPANPNLSIVNFNFNIAIESKADSVNKLIFVVVFVEIKNDDQSLVLGSIKVSCIFNIVNFEELITTNETGQPTIHPGLIEILNVVSLSTTRGVMFSTFKGTFLHNAVLPILDPKTFAPLPPAQQQG